MKLECMKHGETEGERVKDRLYCKKCLAEALQKEVNAEKERAKKTKKEELDPEKEKFVKEYFKNMSKKYNLDSKHGKEYGTDPDSKGGSRAGVDFEGIFGDIFGGK
jgi:hypothetical protein